MALRFKLRKPEFPVVFAECGAVELVVVRAHVSSAVVSAAIAQREARFGLKLCFCRHAQVDRAPDGQWRAPVLIGGRLIPTRFGLMLPWSQPWRAVQRFPDHARKKNVTGVHLPGLTGGAE